MHTSTFRRSTARFHEPSDGCDLLGAEEMKVLSEEEERRLIAELIEIRSALMVAIATLTGLTNLEATSHDDFRELIRAALESRLGAGAAAVEANRLAQRYEDVRDRIALANIRLVAYAARRYLNRGVSYSDLVQEGFCGLLVGIDRFDPSNGTRLATYALWWIKQALRRTISADAYPVRLNPKLLRQIAIEQEAVNRDAAVKQTQRPHVAATLKSIRCAIRPTIPYDVALETGAASGGIEQSASLSCRERETAENGEYLDHLMTALTPREQRVLRLRFGLDGAAPRSLSQVSELLNVSKERIRQIQETALEKLRALEESRSSARIQSIDTSSRPVRIVL